MNFPTPGTPRTRDGKPDLTAPAPRALDGKLDLSGVWRHEITPPRELRQLFNDTIDGARQVEAPGMEAAANQKYSRNILLDFNAETSPLRPEAAEIMRRRAAAANPADVCNVGQFRIPLAGLLAELIKIVQAPRMTVMFYEIDNLHRQIYTDGRTLPAEFEFPAFLGYSVGHWERDVFVVENRGYTRPFTIRVPHDLMPDSDIFEMFCNENEKDRAHLRNP